MFENILGQEEAVERLKRDFANDSLPGSILFEGPELSAKLTCALELARVNSCEKKGLWNCACPQCSRHRLLAHQDLMILGSKETREELFIAQNMLERAPGLPSRYFFIRAVRKLTRRFDAELYEGEESKLNKALPLVRMLLEGIDACLRESCSDPEAATEAKKLLPACDKLYDLVPSSTPVFQVRAMEYHARLAPWSKRKTIIIEHADRMLDSSRNALLKILEEPPAQSTFILTTTRRKALIPTILSRVRVYPFLVRTAGSSRQVLERIFRSDDSEYRTLVEFFTSYRKSGASGMKVYGEQFIAGLLLVLGEKSATELDPALKTLAAKAQRDAKSTLLWICSETSSFGGSNEAMAWTFPGFLEGCSSAISDLLRESGANNQSLRLAENFAAHSRDALLRYNSFNINPVALSERLLENMLETRL